MAITSYSIIGEKIQKSLEPLLATPVTDSEILLGKNISVFIPVIITIYIGAVIFMFLVDIFISGKLGYLYYPNWSVAVMLLILVPLMCLLSIGLNLLISSRSNDIRSANQFGAIILLPLMAIYVLLEMGIIPLTIINFLIMSAIILVLDIIIFYITKATFQREEILTRWK